ncbi:MAG: hypothetical protein J6U64_03920 [Alphaproteobacteria bacterium]|nr:hypothetical protein [Alphaproteobacteria bacterium]
MSNLLEHLKEKNSATLSITSNEMVSFVHFFLSYGEENRNGERKNEQAYDALCPAFKENDNLKKTLTKATELPVGIKILLSDHAYKFNTPSELLTFIREEGTTFLKEKNWPNEEIEKTKECLETPSLKTMLNESYSLYHEHFWKKNKSDIERFSSTEVNSTQLDIFNSSLNQMRSFLGNTTEKIPPVFLVPCPPNGGRSSSKRDRYISLGFYLGRDTLLERLPTLTHECFHELYACSSIKKQIEENLEQDTILSDFFKEFPQEKAYKSNTPKQAVKSLFNETMACAFQALHQEKQTGVHSPKLYNDPMIHSCAVKMLPVLKKYISEKKPLDLEFITEFKKKASEVCIDREQELKKSSTVNGCLKQDGRQ